MIKRISSYNRRSSTVPKFTFKAARFRSLRLIVLTLVTIFSLNLSAGLFQLPLAQAHNDTTEVKTVTTLQTQLITQDVAPGQFSSRLNVISSGNEIQIGAENLQPPSWSGNWATFGMFSSEVLPLHEPFNRLQAHWQADLPDGTRLELDLRASPDGQNWTLWEVLEQSGNTASFDPNRAYLYAQYRVRLFSTIAGVSPLFKAVQLEANRRDLNNLAQPNAFNIMANANNPPPTYNVYATRQGMVGATTANGHRIEPNDRFVSLPSWTALNERGKSDYRVRITAPNGRTAVAPVWDVGPWNFKDNYWHNPRYEFKDLPVGVPQAEKAFFGKHNKGKNENGAKVYNPSGMDIGDGTYWGDLGLAGASAGKLNVTFIWEGTLPAPAVSDTSATNVGSGTANIIWKTNLSANGWVEYGFDSGYGFNTAFDNNMATSHNLFLNDLVPNRTYHFRAHSKDIYGTEAVSGDLTFTTLLATTTRLSSWQNDRGIGVTISPNFDAVTVAGGRANQSYWNDNPQQDTNAGAHTLAGNVNPNGALDLDLVPTCDDKGQNCAFGFGSGYKGYVQLTNSVGDIVQIGLIHDLAISPSGVTMMVEGKIGGNSIARYSPPDSLDPTKPHHLHALWLGGQLYLTFDYNAQLQYTFNADGLGIAFAGAGRAKDDVIAINYQNIGFSWGSVVTP
ncbi:MAG: hypothetical protein WCS37_12245 [Chloroflexota bacterium]|nr:hypothetical protein [Chloroflexota bacterium]